MHTSLSSKFIRQSRSLKDDQAEEWLQLKVDTNKAHKPSKPIFIKKKYNLYFTPNVGYYLSKLKPLVYNLRRKSPSDPLGVQ